MTIPKIEKKKIDKRRQILFDFCTDIKQKEGIEIGALCYPTISKQESNIQYLDLLPKSELGMLGKEYPAEIVDVDIVTNGASLVDILTDRKFDYFIGNHVIEHIPDFITWLQELHSLLKPGGFVFLAVPDKRFTFDSERPETSCGHLIVDFENGIPVDSAGHHLDALIYHAEKPEIIWNSIKQGRHDFIHHHHIFNSETFLDRIIRPLIRLKYLKFSVMCCETASALYNEFVLIMRKEEDFDAVRIFGKKPELQSRPASDLKAIACQSCFPDEIKEIRDIAQSNMFYEGWYLKNYPAVEKSGLNPLRHYYFSGYKLGYNPSPEFDSVWYLEQNPDVAAANYNPLWHYIICGKGEGRKPKPKSGLL